MKSACVGNTVRASVKREDTVLKREMSSLGVSSQEGQNSMWDGGREKILEKCFHQGLFNFNLGYTM